MPEKTKIKASCTICSVDHFVMMLMIISNQTEGDKGLGRSLLWEVLLSSLYEAVAFLLYTGILFNMTRIYFIFHFIQNRNAIQRSLLKEYKKVKEDYLLTPAPK